MHPDKCQKIMVREVVKQDGVRDHDRLDFSRLERDRLQRQLRAALDQKARAFDQGFAAAIEMFERGATPVRLRGMLRAGSASLARGTVMDVTSSRPPREDDTAPFVLAIDPRDIK